MVPRILPTLILSLLLVCLPLSAETGTNPVVLTYHIVQSPSDTFFSMTREDFRLQMDYLRDTGYTVISLADLYDYVTGKLETIPKNAVVITVDDGWKCTYTEIYPVLKEMGFPFTVFIYPNFIGKSAYALSWDQIVEMAADGVDIQSHTNSHPFLTKRAPSALRAELLESKGILEEKTGKPVRFLAYPYGDYNQAVVKATEEAGYDAGLTCNFGAVSRDSNPFRMNRFVIYQNTSFATFRKHLGVGDLRLSETTPARGGTFEPSSPVISARIADFESLDPESVQLSILGLNRTPFSYDPRDGTISLVVRDPLPGGRYQVAIWGFDRDTGKRKEALWSFTLPTSRASKSVLAESDPPAGKNLPAEGASGATGGSNR
ncbi:MAG TPA: polysaccharide deacetylase family protein [Thermoanaerobaculia bacterium]|nr:polysaccharide deacetylase family protein [Thermoanaerobaculia bacterium]